MRCSILSFLPLLLATFLVIADTSFGSPSYYDPRKPSIDVESSPDRSLDTPHFHAVTREAAPGTDNWHLRHKRDILNPSGHPSAALIQRHNHIMDRLRLHSGDSSLAKRSLTGDLMVMGFTLLWDHADVIVSSSLAYYRTTEYYKNITLLAGGEFRFGPTVQNYMIAYGCLRLTFEPMADAFAHIAGELAREFPDGFGPFMRGFAQVMLGMTAVIVFGTYTILAFTVMFSIRITMAIVQNAPMPELITTP